jgi:leucyl/phenylalanyl-tRNA--protein transferase
MLSFPHPMVHSRTDGLLAIGADLSLQRLLLAYRFGIFPWFNEGDPILWWFSHPRMVLFPEKVKVQKSMRPYFNQGKYTATFNQAFSKVVDECKQVRIESGEGTWIHTDLVKAYEELHEQGYAHSVEVWDKVSNLIGGLYGISIGKIFFGESMFHRKKDASKFALISLAQHLQKCEFTLIDCQMETGHLRRMGAELISKNTFWSSLMKNLSEPDHQMNLRAY